MFRPSYRQCPLGTFIYYIRPGDTFNKLALRFKTTVNALSNANPSVDLYQLRIGQQICIPRRPSFPACPFGTYYQVKPGDTLNKISHRNNITLQNLLRLNPGIDPDLIYVNQIICIPLTHTGRPPIKEIPVTIEGMTEYREATLRRSDQGYSIYVLDNFTFTSEEPGADKLFFNNDARYFVRIELLPDNADLNSLKKSAQEELKLLGAPEELKGVDIFDPFFRNAAFFLRASNPSLSKDIIVMEIKGELFRFSMSIPSGEASEGVVPSSFAMLKTIAVT